MYKLLSGAKSVKQYRGDENLPEAKNGMKNCGCKHPKAKYRYGTGAIVIPENSAIVTAKHGLGRKAVEAHLRGDDEEVENIIKKMPPDNKTPSKGYKYKNDGGNKKLKSSYALGYVPPKQRKSGNYYGGVTAEQFEELKKNNPWYDWKNFDPSREGDVRRFQESFNKLSESLGSNARLSLDDKLGEQTVTAKVDYMADTSPEKGTDDKTQTETDTGKKEDIFATNKRKGNFLQNIPSLAEVAAKSSVLSQGVENVPENYLTLSPYEYASQLPKTLREIQLAEQRGAESGRDMMAGDAGRYLSFRSSLSSEAMKNANDAVIQDTLARQDILNRNKDILNRQNETNLGLKNQYIQQKAMNRGAYNNMLVSLGQSIDTATDASKLMANQKSNDDIRTKLLETGNYMMNPDGTVVLKHARKGIKKVKTYKRR